MVMICQILEYDLFERVMGLEPTIFCLGSKRSTTELHPHRGQDYSRVKGDCQVFRYCQNCNDTAFTPHRGSHYGGWHKE